MGRADGPGSESEGNSHGGGSGGGSNGGGGSGGSTYPGRPGGESGERGGGGVTGGGGSGGSTHPGRPGGESGERGGGVTGDGNSGRGRQDGPGSRTEGNNVIGPLSNLGDFIADKVDLNAAIQKAAKIAAKVTGAIGDLFTARDIADDLEQGDTRGVVEKVTEFISGLFSVSAASAAASSLLVATGGSPAGWLAVAGAFIAAGFADNAAGEVAGEVYDLIDDLSERGAEIGTEGEARFKGQFLSEIFNHDGTVRNFNPYAKPIALDLDGDGRLSLASPLSSAALVQLNADGYMHRTGWVGPNDGMLVYDRNGDGRVTFANELSFTGYVAGARTDLEGLRHFDSNNDGRLDAGDREWSKFRVWKDANSNGTVDPGEMVTPASLGLVSLNLAGEGAERTVNGNRIYGKTGFTKTDGTTMAVWDVGLGTTGHGVKVFQNAHYFKIQTKAPDGTISDHLISRSTTGLDIDVAQIPGIAGFQGTAQADTIRNGSSRDMLIHGGDGDDTITGGTGRDTIVGGDGADRLIGGEGNDILIGGAGRDIFTGGTASLVELDYGNIFNVADRHQVKRQQDVNEILQQADVVTDFGRAGNQPQMAVDVTEIWVRAARAPDGYDGVLLTGFNGATDTVVHYVFLRGQQSTRWPDVYAGDRNAFIQMAYERLAGFHAQDNLYSRHFVNGSKITLMKSIIGRDDRAERMVGSNNSEHFDGGGGNDSIHGGGGDDRLYGGDGDDKLYGGANDDYLSGWNGADILNGNGGHDTVHGGEGNDKLYGGDGNDRLYGSANDDLLSGWTGADTLDGNGGHDTIYGGDGNDKLYGGNGNDKLYGGANDDYLSGWTGADRIYGGGGDDRLLGGANNDVLYGGSGRDVFAGWRGSDWFGVSDVTDNLAQADRITDFGFGGERDRIYIADIGGGMIWYRHVDVDNDGTQDTVLFNNSTGEIGIYAILEDFSVALTSEYFNDTPTIIEIT